MRYNGGVISAANQELFAQAIEHVRQRRAATAVQSKKGALHAGALKGSGTLYAGALNGGSATSSSAKQPAASKSTDPAITPYLTATDLMGASAQTAAAERADTAAQFGLATAAANAVQNKGDIERSRVSNVADVNDNAAARGIYNSGIRTGGVGMANTTAARGHERNQAALAMAAQQSTAQSNSAKQELAAYMQALAAKAAENGMALPVAPQNGAVNVKGSATAKKVRPKAKAAAR